MTRPLGVALLLALASAAAQTPDSTAADTTILAPAVVAPADSVVTRGVVPPAVALPGVVARRGEEGAEADSSRAPARALRRSLILPGWGQATNGQTLKVPVVAAALAGATTVLVLRQRRYTLYRRSALFAGCLDAPDRDVCADVSGARDEWEQTGSPSFAQASAIRNTVRGQRDVAGLVVGVVYALQALDAYIAAQLLGFDVSEDVAVRATPAGVAVRVAL